MIDDDVNLSMQKTLRLLMSCPNAHSRIILGSTTSTKIKKMMDCSSNFKREAILVIT